MADAQVYTQNRTSLIGYVKKTEVIALLQSTMDGNASNESQELQDMIDMLSAYWKLARKRYVDNVGQTITDLFTSPDLLKRLQTEIAEKIIGLGEEGLTGLFIQNKQIQIQRLRLDEQIKTMKQAKTRLDVFMS
jgi:Tat protein secretion system quality control protein TatD with DNase activity